jgi:hypothetical protein
MEQPLVRSATHGEVPLRKLFSKGQRAFLAAEAPDGPSLDDLQVLGPLLVLKARMKPPELGRRLVGELWLFPDGSRVIELSTKTVPGQAIQTAVEARVFLAERGIDVGGEQQTKTRKALEFFAGTLR